MLAYCAGLSQERGFLVYARDVDQRSRTHRIRDGQTTIEVRAVALEAPPDEILGQVESLAREIVGSSSNEEQSQFAAAG
jgi:5-methylcytosine-specific restriction enzyme subunit McrC